MVFHSAASSSSAVVGSPLAVAGASVLMAKGCSRYIISDRGLSQDNIHSLSDLDNTEDFQLTKGANVEHFGPSMLRMHSTKPSSSGSHKKRQKKKKEPNGLSVCSVHFVMPEGFPTALGTCLSRNWPSYCHIRHGSSAAG